MSRNAIANRRVEVHVVGVFVRLKRLTLLDAECRLHLSEQFLQCELLRPGQVEHLHNTPYGTATTKPQQVSKLVRPHAASATCQPSRPRMDSSDFYHV